MFNIAYIASVTQVCMQCVQNTWEPSITKKVMNSNHIEDVSWPKVAL